jgi:hypothetical protein
MAAWGRRSAARLPALGARRVKNLGHLIATLSRGTAEELRNAMAAWKKGSFSEHVGSRIGAGADNTIEFSKNSARTIAALGKFILKNPKGAAPGILALAFGFVYSSGGLDGNGGIPDMDIALMGIGDHRSILTHSVLSGVLVEGAILAAADLADIVCEKLPVSDRSEFWGRLARTKDDVAKNLTQGVSAGISYHLAVDGVLQVAPYKDLPFSMPMEAHQLLFILNSTAEGWDAKEKTKYRRPMREAPEDAKILRGKFRRI